LTSDTDSAKRELRPRGENQDMCDRVNWNVLGTPTTTTSVLLTTTSSVQIKKMTRNQVSVNFPVSIAFILAVLGQQF
jgi:hypothetical protein